MDEPKLAHTADALSLAFNESHDPGTISDQDARLLGTALRLLRDRSAQAMTRRVDLQALTDDAETRTSECR